MIEKSTHLMIHGGGYKMTNIELNYVIDVLKLLRYVDEVGI